MQDLDISEKSLSHRAILSEISHAKDELTSPKEYEEAAGEDFRLKLVARAYKAYSAAWRTPTHGLRRPAGEYGAAVPKVP